MDEQKNKIKLFEEKQVRAIWDEELVKWWFSVVDVIAILTEQQDDLTARKYWNKLKQRLKEEGNETVTNCHQLKMLAKDGKMRLTDVADTEQVLRIIQSVPSKKAEPFKMWLAKIGNERIDDTAYDALDDLRNTQTIIDDMKKYFEDVIKAEYVEYDEGHYALVSAAVIDSVINDVDYRCYDEEGYIEWTKSLKNFDFIPLKQIAVMAIDAVLSDNSELNELWAENKELYKSWRKDKIDIRDRLK